ncbi:MAG: DNA polymerase III subunit delta [Parcubacteria group bacterium]|jgi:DNA polymerase-3 subunit delta|nr:DNA polymerase III subunit delta [Parcubacteria group bacterium]|tara:strand:- start:7209 stop:8141 length:933 start_codon:yes stop_codon:yes gene_type:complete
MIILLYGEDTFRQREKLNEIIEQYQAKHQSGLDLMRFREEDLNFDKFRQKVEVVSMFDEKKLIVLENLFNKKDFQEDFFEYLKKSKLKDNQDILVVIYQSGKLPQADFKRRVSMSEEFSPLDNLALARWVKKEVDKNKVSISQGAIRKLIIYTGNDLWQISNELNKLIDYKKGQLIDEQDIDLLVKAKIDTNIFKAIDALAQRDKKTAFRLLHEHLSQGDNEIYLLSMFIYQLRTLLRLKDLTEKGTPFYNLAKQSGLHPFVVRKSAQQLKNFSLDQLKRIYQYLMKIDWELKTGQIDGPTALDLLIAEI